MYLLTVVYFSTNSIYQLIDRPDTQTAADPNLTENKLITLIDSRDPVITPSIYLLVYDAYVVNETLQAYGIDNQLQEQYLEDQNFKLILKVHHNLDINPTPRPSTTDSPKKEEDTIRVPLEKKTVYHLYSPKTSTACGHKGSTTTDKDEVNCGSCENTKAFKESE